MDIFLIIIAGILMVTGIAGCIVPGLPGPPLGYLALIIMELTSAHPYSAEMLIFYALLTIGVTIADYILPILGAKRYGSSKYGVWGSIIGLVLGPLIIPVIGILVGPFIGAVVGEIMVGKKEFEDGLRAGFGSFLGLLGSTIIQLVLSLVFFYHYIIGIIENI